MVNITTYKLQYIKEKTSRYEVKKRIQSPKDARDIFESVFNMSVESEEILAMLVLDTKNQVIGAFEVSRGAINSSIVHPREVYKRALLINGNTIMIAHNHPSGDPTPSREDINITQRLREAGAILGVELLDHLIFGDECYISLKDRGQL